MSAKRFSTLHGETYISFLCNKRTFAIYGKETESISLVGKSSISIDALNFIHDELVNNNVNN